MQTRITSHLSNWEFWGTYLYTTFEYKRGTDSNFIRINVYIQILNVLHKILFEASGVFKN